MKIFTEYYLKAIAMILYCWLLLPWCLSQRSDLIVAGGFISIFLVIFLIVKEGYKIYKRIEGDRK